MKQLFILIIAVLNISFGYSQNQSEKPFDPVSYYSKENRGNRANYSNTTEEDPWNKTIQELGNKRQLHTYSSIKESELYETLPNGTRRAKYPYVPSWATTIEQVEQYFKEHPSEMNNYKDYKNQSSTKLLQRNSQTNYIKNQSPQSSSYSVNQNRAYFYSQPSFEFKRKSFLVFGDIISGKLKKNGFVFVEYVNSNGIKTTGWLLISDLD